VRTLGSVPRTDAAGAGPAPPITTPTRVLRGGRDPVLRAAWMDRLRPGSGGRSGARSWTPQFFTELEASIAPGAGHFVRRAWPQLAAAEIRAFFARIGYLGG